MSKLKSHFLLSLLVLGLTSCTQPSVVNETMSVDGNLWNAADTKTIEFEVKDTLEGNNFYFLVKNNDDYPYRNLYVYLNLEFPNNKLAKDTILCELADKYGKWMGKGVGGAYSNEFLYKRSQKFPMKGKYRITIEQAMREKDISGITNVGISIRKNK